MACLAFILFTLIVSVSLTILSVFCVSLRASMASSSSSLSSSSSTCSDDKLQCFHCKSEITTFINGWPLDDGTVAQLCNRCGSHFEDGSFCETFHWDHGGWEDCIICNKRLHCGCVVSKNEVHFTLLGKICCNDCARKLIRGE